MNFLRTVDDRAHRSGGRRATGGIVAALALGLAAATPAAAAVFTFTATGTVVDGFDQSGRFGAANTSLAGAAYSVVAYFDTSIGTFTTSPTSDVAQNGSIGTLTINGHSEVLTGNKFSALHTTISGTNGLFLDDQFNVGDVETVNSLFVSLNHVGLLPDFHMTPGLSSDCTGAFSCGGAFFFTAYKQSNSSVNYYLDSGHLSGSSFTISGPVPEPATWAMMILGFGLAGGALRRRRAEVSL